MSGKWEQWRNDLILKKVDNIDYDLVHDRIFDVFDIDVSVKQIEHLFLLCPKECFEVKNEFIDEDVVISHICYHFIGMKVPRYIDDQEYKDLFYNKIGNVKSSFEKYIQV